MRPISLNRSTLQMSLCIAVLVRVGIELLRKIYFEFKDRSNGDSMPSKIFLNEPEDVPIIKPDLSNSANVSMSLKYETVLNDLVNEPYCHHKISSHHSRFKLNSNLPGMIRPKRDWRVSTKSRKFAL